MVTEVRAPIEERVQFAGQQYDFSGGQTVVDGIIVADGNGKPIFPTHELSGLPLPVLPIEPPNDRAYVWTDEDHGYYPERSEQLQGLGGRAVRHSRVQRLPRWLHERKHSVFPEGPKLPETDAERHLAVLLACTDYVPRKAVEIHGPGNYRIIECTDRQLEAMRTSREIHAEGMTPSQQKATKLVIGWFFADFALQQDLSHISERVTDQFLSAASVRRRMELGNLMLAKAVKATVMPVHDRRQELLDAGLVQLSRREMLTAVRKFFIKGRFPDYLPELHTRLGGEPLGVHELAS